MSMVAQMVHLEPEQKKALQERAARTGRSLSAEIRLAIDEHLKNADETARAEFDLLMRQTADAIDRMQENVLSMRRRLADTFDAIAQLRTQDKQPTTTHRIGRHGG